ncbi:hypothetical protein HHI36_014405, partial [Cryptolaemus montrouzieri]
FANLFLIEKIPDFSSAFSFLNRSVDFQYSSSVDSLSSISETLSEQKVTDSCNFCTSQISLFTNIETSSDGVAEGPGEGTTPLVKDPSTGCSEIPGPAPAPFKTADLVVLRRDSLLLRNIQRYGISMIKRRTKTATLEHGTVFSD